MISKLIPTIFVLFSVTQAADFLIVSHPRSLAVFNQYEQPLSDSDRKTFLPYSPLEIVNKKELLGDQITEAIRIRYQGNIYYLLKDDKGEFSGKSAQQYQSTFKNCTVLDDTVEAGKKLTFYEKYSSSGSSFSVNKGERVTRIFRNGSKFYILKQGGTGRYGWYSGSPADFTVQKKAVRKTAIQRDISEIENRIKSRIQATNESYSGLFVYFNQITHQQKMVPEWNFSSDGESIKCTLIGSRTLVSQMEQSTKYVVQGIERMLLGEPFTVSYKTGTITISPDKK